MDTAVSDDQLALAAGAGNSDAFRQLLERNYDHVFRLAYRFSGHREDAEDITQDICLSLAGRLQSYRGKSAFRTWLYRVVLNCIRDRHRREAATKTRNRAYGELEHLLREDARQAEAEARWLADMMDRLPETLKETAVLVVGEGLSHAGAAEVLGVSEGTVSWRIAELKKALREFARQEA